MRTIQLLIAACLVSYAFADSVKIGYAAESGDGISYQSSTWSLSFQWEATSITDPEYAIGISDNVEKYLSYTADSTFSGTSAAGVYHPISVAGLEFEAEDNVIVTLRSQATQALLATSTAVHVGSAQRFSCPAFFDPEPILGGTKNTPVDPSNVTVSWDSNNSKMKFEVTVEYLQWGYTWFIDFNPFTALSTNGRNGFAYGSCENKIASHFTGRNFAEYFNAAPTATSADANGGTPAPLGNDNYLAYQHAGSPWVATAIDCHTVKFTAYFLPTELAACTNGSTGRPIVVNTDTSITYIGTLYVAGVKARDTSAPSAGFEVTTFQYPFEFDFNIAAEAVLEGETSQTLTYTIDRVNLVLSSGTDYFLHFQLSTDTHASTFFLASGLVTAHPSGADLGFVGTAPGETENQVWQLQTATAKTAGAGINFDGSYSIQWTRDETPSSPSRTTESITINVKMSVVPKVTNVGALVIALGFYDNSFTNAVAPVYTREDVIFIRSVVQTKNALGEEIALPSSENNKFKNTIRNVWICWTTNNLPPVAGTGCQVENSQVRPIGQLVIAGVPFSGASIAGQFGTDTFVNKPDGIHAGLSIKAQPLLAIHPGKFYVHVESRITDPSGAKRTVTTVSAVDRTKANSFDFYDFVQSGAISAAPRIILLAAASIAAVLLF
jgi:hypothetical protein